MAKGIFIFAGDGLDRDADFEIWVCSPFPEKQKPRSHNISFILLLASILLPLFIACLGLLPSIAAVDGFAASHLLYPALYGKRHAVPLAFNLGLLPTRAQTMFIICMILLNFILSVLGYESTLSNASIFNYTAFEERLEHFANRVGILCFANLPGMILYSSRNNPLIRLTGWPYGTFLLYHRWIAYICVSQASLHSLIWVMLHIHVLPHKFTQPYWIIGTLATICFILVVPSSALFVRRRYYEIFLNLHVLFAISVLAGCYYHITLKFEHQWGYENWIYVAILVWITEKTVRTIKMMKNGLKKAIITQIDEEYTRVDIPDVSATGHAYLYFPTLSWMFWQNHPFSIASSVYEWKEFDVDEKNLSQPDDSVFQLVGSDSGSDTGSDVEDEREEGHMLSDLNTQRQRGGTTLIVPETSMSPEVPHSAMALLPNSFHDNDMTRESLDSHHPARIPERFNTGLTFYIRRHKGITASLNGSNRIDIPVILEAPYQSSSRSVFATYKHVVCIIGGAGISTVLPILHDRASANAGRTVLYWGSRSPSLVREVEVDRLIPAGIEVRVRVGERWDVAGLVRRETRSGSGDVVVFVSGPAGMADDARQAVVQANKLRVKQKRGGLVILVEECFSW